MVFNHTKICKAMLETVFAMINIICIVCVFLFISCGLAFSDCLKLKSGAEEDIIQETGMSVYINQIELNINEPLWMLNGVTYLALEPSLILRLNLDMTIFREEHQRVLQVLSGETKMEFVENECTFSANGEDKPSPAVPLFDTIYPAVPIRAFFEALGGIVYWSPDEKRVDIKITGMGEEQKVVKLPKEFYLSRLSKPEGKKVEEKTTASPEIPKAKEEEKTAAPPEAPKAKEEEKPVQQAVKRFQYTYENTVGIDSSQVGGDISASYIQEKTVTHNLFSFRAKDLLDNGYEMNAVVRSIGTTDNDMKNLDFDNLTVSLGKGPVNYEMYDIVPKFSRFLLKDYRLQGVSYKRGDDRHGFDVVMGKTPKETHDSEYARYVGGMRYTWGGEDSVFQLNYIQTQDTGSERAGSGERVKNRVAGVGWAASPWKAWNLQGEYALGNAWGLGMGGGKSGCARYLKTSYQARKTRLTFLYESAGANFVSETAYFTPNRTEFSTLYQRKPSEKFMYIVGYKNRIYRGERTYFYPTSITIQPFNNRAHLKMTLGREFQRTIGQQSNIIDNRNIRTQTKFGVLGVETYFSRRKDKDNVGTVLFRNTKNLKIFYPFSEKLNTTIQFNREKRQGSTTPLLRQFRTTFEYELKEWTDLIISTEQYYNGTTSDHTSANLGLRKVNVYDDWEIGFEFQFVNYRDHNDQVSKISYSFLR